MEDPGETALEAGVRELSEEAGLQAEIRPFKTYQTTWGTLHVFSTESPSGFEPQICTESDAYQWTQVDDLPDNLVEPLPQVVQDWMNR